MRWEYKVEKLPSLGDTKVERKFLWFPKTLYNEGLDIQETRLWETASIQYRYSWSLLSETGGQRWMPTRFVD